MYDWLVSGEDLLHCRKSVYSYSLRPWKGLVYSCDLSHIIPLSFGFFFTAYGVVAFSDYPVLLHSSDRVLVHDAKYLYRTNVRHVCSITGFARWRYKCMRPIELRKILWWRARAAKLCSVFQIVSVSIVWCLNQIVGCDVSLRSTSLRLWTFTWCLWRSVYDDEMIIMHCRTLKANSEIVTVSTEHIGNERGSWRLNLWYCW